MGDVIKTIEEETDGKSYRSHKYCHDVTPTAGIYYDDTTGVVWKNYGETVRHARPVDVKKLATRIAENDSLFTYFLDGSRHTYKVDDISYNNNVYPIIAGQIGVGCCKRVNKELKKEIFKRKLIIVLPDVANNDEWGATMFFEKLLQKVNESNELQNKYRIQFDEITQYNRNKDDKLENKGIAVVQERMIEMEKDTVEDLVLAGKLNQDHYLVKDGSIEYKVSSKNSNKKKNLNDKKIANYYRYVIGVSKSFDPTKCKTKSGGTNSDIIANLKPFERTPAYMYQSEIAGNVSFVIWYLRIREARYTKNIFDGVVKIEKLVITTDEEEKGLDSDLVDLISANIMNERNPVCYGNDGRWANHLYPVYLTESFVKSQYMSNDLFMQLF
ncbi:MAG: hypothetical protein ACC612_00460 [Methanomethylovorans sp.]|uniref:hypothetical protein n=1 Tax=Methanomethylovorans sp. TaxID=2758717 RepID=UPI0035315F11